MECCGPKSESASIRPRGTGFIGEALSGSAPIESEGTQPIEAGEQYRPDDERGLYAWTCRLLARVLSRSLSGKFGSDRLSTNQCKRGQWLVVI